MHSSGKTPLIRLAKRDGMAGAGQWGIRIAAILLALVVGGLVILLSGMLIVIFIRMPTLPCGLVSERLEDILLLMGPLMIITQP